MSWIEYCDHYDWFPQYRVFLHSVAVVGVVVLNHILYKRDHRRSNNYLGRTLTDCLLLVFGWLTAEVIHTWSYGRVSSFNANVTMLVTGIIVFGLSVMFFELMVAGLKRILNKLKWRVL